MNNEICGITSRRTILTGNCSHHGGEAQATTRGRAITATFPKLMIYLSGQDEYNNGHLDMYVLVLLSPGLYPPCVISGQLSQ